MVIWPPSCHDALTTGKKWNWWTCCPKARKSISWILGAVRLAMPPLKRIRKTNKRDDRCSKLKVSVTAFSQWGCPFTKALIQWAFSPLTFRNSKKQRNESSKRQNSLPTTLLPKQKHCFLKECQSNKRWLTGDGADAKNFRATWTSETGKVKSWSEGGWACSLREIWLGLGGLWVRGSQKRHACVIYLTVPPTCSGGLATMVLSTLWHVFTKELGGFI